MNNDFNQYNVAIIGVRSGSKGLPDKNIKLLGGRPLVHWIIEAASRTPEIDRVIVSTDSEHYAEIAQQAGAEAPFLRPAEISNDASTDYEYVKHCLEYLDESEGLKPNIAVRLMATVPFQRSQDISAIIRNCLVNNDVDSSVIVSEARQHPEKALAVVEDEVHKNRLVGYQCRSAVGVEPKPRQKYSQAYFRSNAIAFRTRNLDDYRSLTVNVIIPHVIASDYTVDIDTEIDFKFAEYLVNEEYYRI